MNLNVVMTTISISQWYWVILVTVELTQKFPGLLSLLSVFISTTVVLLTKVVIYACVSWIITTNILCAYKLHPNINKDNKLSQNKMACHALNKRTIVIIMTKDYDEIDVNMNKIDNVYQFHLK